MVNLYPKIQIFDFVPKIQVWNVSPDNLELFWYPLPKEVARQYRLYYSTSYSGPFNFLKLVPNNWQPPGYPPYTPGVIYTRISKSELGFGDIAYFFKVTTIAPNGNEIPPALTNVPVKPVFTIEEHRLRGRSYDRPGKTSLAFQETIVAGSSYTDNYIDIAYILGRIGTSIDLEVTNTTIYVKFNSISALPIRVRDTETLELMKTDLDVTKIFMENSTEKDAEVQILATG